MNIIMHTAEGNVTGVFTTQKAADGHFWGYFNGTNGIIAIRCIEVYLHGERGLTLKGFTLKPAAHYCYETFICSIAA